MRPCGMMFSRTLFVAHHVSVCSCKVYRKDMYHSLLDLSFSLFCLILHQYWSLRCSGWWQILRKFSKSDDVINNIAMRLRAIFWDNRLQSQISLSPSFEIPTTMNESVGQTWDWLECCDIVVVRRLVGPAGGGGSGSGGQVMHHGRQGSTSKPTYWANLPGSQTASYIGRIPSRTLVRLDSVGGGGR
jgi:hypothetical protein